MGPNFDNMLFHRMAPYRPRHQFPHDWLWWDTIQIQIFSKFFPNFLDIYVLKNRVSFLSLFRAILTLRK